MIIFGYPGIGKTTFCEKYPFCIDLESSKYPNKDEYVEEILELHRKRQIVFASTHAEVIDKVTARVKYKEEILILFPHLDLKKYWIQKLRRRYEGDDSLKNLRALLRAEDYFDKDVRHLWYDCKGIKRPIATMNYHLENIILCYIPDKYRDRFKTDDGKIYVPEKFKKGDIK